MKNITKKYSNGEITIVWKPDLCIHLAICVRGLPDVFDNKKSPWVTPENSTTETITQQVDKCPSGALSWYRNDASGEEKEVTAENILEVTKNGPLLVYGNIIIKDSEGNETRKNKVTAFCRCGQSSNKPFCDGSHTKNGFQG